MHRFALGVILTFIALNSALAATPRTLSYQGSLTNADGSALPDGDYALTFRLWDAPTAGLELWQETDTVAVVAGLFNATLGRNTPLASAFDEPYWLGITIGSESELAPRTELAGSPYALHADLASSAERAAVADSLSGGLPGDLSCGAYRTDPYSLPSGTWTALPLTLEQWDTGGFHGTTIEPTRFYAPRSGVYSVSGFVTWSDGNLSGRRGAALRAHETYWFGYSVHASSGWNGETVSGLVRLVQGDYVELFALQDSGQNRPTDDAQLHMILVGR